MRMLLIAAMALSASANAYDFRYIGTYDGWRYYMDLANPTTSFDGLPQAWIEAINPDPGWFQPAGHSHKFSIDCQKKHAWAETFTIRNKDRSARKHYEGRGEMPFYYEAVPMLKIAAEVTCGIKNGQELIKAYDLPESLQ